MVPLNEPEPTIACPRCFTQRPPLLHPGTWCPVCGQPGPDAPALAAQAQVPWLVQLERELAAWPRPFLVAILVAASVAALVLAVLIARGDQERSA